MEIPIWMCLKPEDLEKLKKLQEKTYGTKLELIESIEKKPGKKNAK